MGVSEPWRIIVDIDDLQRYFDDPEVRNGLNGHIEARFAPIHLATVRQTISIYPTLRPKNTVRGVDGERDAGIGQEAELQLLKYFLPVLFPHIGIGDQVSDFCPDRYFLPDLVSDRLVRLSTARLTEPAAACQTDHRNKPTQLSHGVATWKQNEAYVKHRNTDTLQSTTRGSDDNERETEKLGLEISQSFSIHTKSELYFILFIRQKHLCININKAMLISKLCITAAMVENSLLEELIHTRSKKTD